MIQKTPVWNTGVLTHSLNCDSAPSDSRWQWYGYSPYPQDKASAIALLLRRESLVLTSSVPQHQTALNLFRNLYLLFMFTSWNITLWVIYVNQKGRIKETKNRRWISRRLSVSDQFQFLKYQICRYAEQCYPAHQYQSIYRHLKPSGIACPEIQQYTHKDTLRFRCDAVIIAENILSYFQCIFNMIRMRLTWHIPSLLYTTFC